MTTLNRRGITISLFLLAFASISTDFAMAESTSNDLHANPIVGRTNCANLNVAALKTQATTMDLIHFDQQMLFSTVLIEATSTNPPKTSLGTAFIYQYSWSTNKTAAFLVTNKHVIHGCDRARIRFTMTTDGRPDLDKHHTVSLAELSSWFFGHPNSDVDITVLPLYALFSQDPKMNSTYLCGITNEQSLTKNYIAHMRANEQVVFFGYPGAIFDKKHNLPLARRGYTSSPIAVDFEGNKEFLVDAAVFPGSSGSPVFIETHVDEKGTTNPLMTQWLFAGVITSVYEVTDEGSVHSRHIPTALEQYVQIKRPVNLGVVIKAERVVEAIEEFLHKHGLK